MGVHIDLERLVSNNFHESKSVSEEFGFDWLRHVGDREFAVSGLFESIGCDKGPYCCDYFLNRPKDFEETRHWIKTHIEEFNQNRLLDLMDVLEKNKDVYLYFSW